MKKERGNLFNPLLGGMIGGGAILIIGVIAMLIIAAVCIGMEDPASYTVAAACIAMGISGCIGGFLSVKLGGALISAVYAAVTTLIILAAVSVFLPESEGVLARVLPPVIAAITPLGGGYVALGRKQTKADVIRKAARKR